MTPSFNRLRALTGTVTTTAEFTVAADEFPLGSSFTDLDDVTVELEKIVPTTATVVPYLWVSGVGPDEVQAALDAHRASQEITIVDSIAGRHLLRVDWNPEYDEFLEIMVEANVALLSAQGTASAWEFVIRGDDHESISAFQAYCRDAGVPIELTSLSELSPEEDGEYGLTDPQREALRLAYERGYFAEPRERTLEEIAEELDISRQALASRLRRAHRQLVERTLIGP